MSDNSKIEIPPDHALIEVKEKKYIVPNSLLKFILDIGYERDLAIAQRDHVIDESLGIKHTIH